MPVEYDLKTNYLTNGKPFVAKVHSSEGTTLDQIERKMSESGSLTTLVDIKAVMTEFFKVLEEEIKEGHRIITPLFTTSFSISGGFDDGSGSYDPKSNALHLNFQPGSTVRKVLQTMRPVRNKLPGVKLELVSVVDAISGSMNEKISSGGVVKVSGKRVKLEGEKARIYFVAEDGAEFDCKTIVTNLPCEVTAISPTLDSGTYHLKLTTHYSGNAYLLKTPHSATLADDLVVE